MFNLTRQEKWILLFLAGFFLIGLGASYFGKPAPVEYKKQLPEVKKLVNINTAGLRELIKIKGIGPKMAERIIDYRETNGPFFYIEDIQEVKGIGPKKFEAVKKWITTN